MTMCPSDWLRGLACAFMLMVSGQVMAADGADQASKSVRSFWRAGQLYELCTSKADNERAHCEGSSPAWPAPCRMPSSRVPICMPKGTSSQDVVSKVVWYLREKADADDLKLPAANLLGPVLAILYNCTPGQPPKFTQP
jgi:hypothetical protein